MSKRAAEDVPATDLPKKAKMATDNGQANVDLDENLHSRQLAVYGREAMRRMAGANVLVAGANGVGVEIGEWVVPCPCPQAQQLARSIAQPLS
jgi:ubiquitin-activating enzyme E1